MLSILPYTCLSNKYVIIQASNQPVSGGKGDTLISLKNQGGFCKFSYEVGLLSHSRSALTFNQGVAGSRPARPTSFRRPSLPGIF
jgi:hypothetical protein